MRMEVRMESHLQDDLQFKHAGIGDLNQKKTREIELKSGAFVPNGAF
jgi:hypothetical protein